MKLKYLLIITVAGVACLVLSKIFWDGSKGESKSMESEPVTYGESVAAASTPSKFVQIQPLVVEDFNYHEVKIDALGYREIRVFAHLSANDYKTQPLPKEALLKVGFSHELVGMGTGYGSTVFKQEVTSYIEGFVIEKVYGKKLKLTVDADNLPKGKYTLHLSYYLLP